MVRHCPRKTFLLLVMMVLSLENWPAVVLADAALGPQGSPITTNQYAIDLFAGPVLSSSRVIAMGGAYAAIAEGVEGNAVNAAAPAIRLPWSNAWFEYDFSPSITLPGMLGGTDFDNNGARGFEYRDFVFLTGGLNLQLGRWGFGALVDSRIYHMGKVDESQATANNAQYVNASLTSAHFLVARSFWRNQLYAGVGLRVAAFNIDYNTRANGMGASTPLFSLSGAAMEAGGIWAPLNLPLRAGLSWRQQVEGVVRTNPNDTSQNQVNMYLPQKVVLPWELEAGLAWEFWSRPLNVDWINPADFMRPLALETRQARVNRGQYNKKIDDQERKLRDEENEKIARQEADLLAREWINYRQMSRRRLLVSGSLLISGPVKNGVGTESFFRRIVDRSGEKISITPRIGAEVEPLQDRLQFRVGSYLEPSRYARWHARLHGTAGIDVKVFPWGVFGWYPDDTYWSVGAVADVAQSYTSASFRVGIWR